MIIQKLLSTNHFLNQLFNQIFFQMNLKLKFQFHLNLKPYNIFKD